MVPQPADQAGAAQPISVGRVRVGILLFIVWWLPIYLLAPAIADLLGKGDDSQARHVITIVIVCIQTVLGLLGVYLAGKEMFSSLGKVRRRRLLPTAWRIAWSGDTHVRDEDLKTPRNSHPGGTTPSPVPGTSVDDVPADHVDMPQGNELGP